MPTDNNKIHETLCANLNDWILSRYRADLKKTLDQDGKPASEKTQITTYVIDLNHKPATSQPVIVSLVDHAQATDRRHDQLTVTYDNSLIQSQDTKVSDRLTELIIKLKEWAKSNLLGFEARDVDIQAGPRPVINESKFSSLTGTMKTSVQTLENTRLIIRHSSVINDDIRGARTRRIHKIYVENAAGERFLMPFTSLRGARAMARHVEQGGNPYDQRGQCISDLSEEATQLSRFLRRTRHRAFENTVAQGMIEAADQRLKEVKSLLNRVSGQRGYLSHATQLDSTSVLEWDQSVKSHFVQNQYDEQLDHSLPYAWRAYNNMKKLKEMAEFESWADRVVNEQDTNPQDPQVQAAEKALGMPVGQEKKPLQIQRTPKGTQITYDPNDTDARKKVASAVLGGKLAKNVAFAPMTENTDEQSIKVVSSKGETRFIPVKPHMDPDHLGHIIEKIKQKYGPEYRFYYIEHGKEEDLAEMLGGDKADRLMQDVMSPHQEPATVDDAESHGTGADSAGYSGPAFRESAQSHKPDADGDGIPDWADKHPHQAGGDDDRKMSESLERMLMLSGVRR
jgi:hypothetical protein